MSDTSAAVVGRIRQDSPMVDAVCRQIELELPAAEAAVAVDFALIFLSKATTEFLGERSTETITKLVLGALAFVRASRPDRVDVQVFNPDMDGEGWYAPVTVIRTNLTERPFIVDTIREFLHAQGLPIEYNIYPVLHVGREADGDVAEVRPSRDGNARESLVHCEVPRIADEATLEVLRDGIERRLADVKAATDDYQPMLAALDATIGELSAHARALPDRREELDEIGEFLAWLRDGAFVFLGYRAYDLYEEDDRRFVSVEADSGLGILRDEGHSTYAQPRAVDELPGWLRGLVTSGPLVVISKTNSESTVHRRARMDYIGVRKLGPNGEIRGEHRFIGLFSSRAFAEQAERIPILRRKLQFILDAAGVAEGSHDYKEIGSIFNSMPKEELFLTSSDEIAADIQAVLTTYHSDAVTVTLRDDPLRRGLTVLVILPKDRFSGDVRREIEEALRGIFDADVLNYHLALGSGDQARLHFYLAARGDEVPRVDPRIIEGTIAELIRTWEDRVREGLERVRPSDEARRLARVYCAAFSPEYRVAADPRTAVDDILELEAMEAEGRTITVGFSNRGGSFEATGDDAFTEVKVHLRGPRLVLSDFMPILESCGLRVIAVNPFDVEGAGVTSAIIYTFAVQDGAGRPLDVDAVGARLAEAIVAARAEEVTTDSLNALVVLAGLHWREVDLLRTYAAYAFQAGAVPSRLSIPSALVKYPHIARLLIDWFEVRFDPDAGLDAADRRAKSDEFRARFASEVAAVELLADDRALRRVALLLEATLRTNFHRTGGITPTRRSGGVPYISLKFDATALAAIQRTRLKFEVFVRSARMEGVHLRGGSVARGGIRWSDRPDDFRTEILGLVKTQMVKNAVIVPGGSKGGFVAHRLPADPEARAEEGREQYRTLVRGLLDLTDNLDASGATIPPERVVAWDDPDPYLVVAADKGTATFSDVANAISAEYGFWLGDAFASGGSNGYDHKEVGITARGAWECVKRHFREMDKDIQSEPFTVAGIGDMSGDVFGNGMLLSPQIRLVAAFDHRHVFIDPDPDPATGFAERTRLFGLGRSSWADYDTTLLSSGGMVVPRGSKEVRLSPEAIRALGLEEDPGVLNGEELIRLVLKAPVELLWNGGIGTYVKASFESHADAGDASNDAVRINARELRAQVVGEGGNLGMTQAARVEYALAGGRLNTDALDNSGGVSLSDREVNLKILLGPAVRTGELPEDERNRLLEDLTEDVALRVLRDNWSQSLAVSLDALRLERSADDFRDLMSTLEREGILDRASEGLPSLEVLVQRAEQGVSLTRPELCVLLAYSKLSVKNALMSDGLLDDPAVGGYLRRYFPSAARERVGEAQVEAHPLRREIIASQLVNDLVDWMGATFVHRVVRDTGATVTEVVRSWFVAASLVRHHEVLAELADPTRSVDATSAYRWVLQLATVFEASVRWLLATGVDGDSTDAMLDRHRAGVDLLLSDFEAVVSGQDRASFNRWVEEFVELGAQPTFARALVTRGYLDHAFEIVSIAQGGDFDVLDAGRAYYRVADTLSLPWLHATAAAIGGDDRWSHRAAKALTADLVRAHHRIVTRVLHDAGDHDVSGALGRLVRGARRDMDRLRDLMAEVRADEPVGLAALSVVVREISAMADRTAGGRDV